MVTAEKRNGTTHEVATRVVALVGTAGSSRDLVHEQGDDVELWGLNASYTWMPRWDRWFEMHDRGKYDHFVGEHLAWLQAAECPVYMVQHYADIPHSQAFPVERATQNGRFRSLFTSSVAYMLGLAVAEGFQEIRLCGIDMAMESEYAHQRAACEYWIGVAEGLGIKVTIPDVSPIGKAALYGHGSPDTNRMILDWTDRMETERIRRHEDFMTKAYSLSYEARVELKAGTFQDPAKVTEFIEGLQEFIDTSRANQAAVEGAIQLLQKMQRQDGG